MGHTDYMKKVPGHKVCKMCKQLKPYSAFASGKAFSWAAAWWCMECLSKTKKRSVVEGHIYKKVL